MFTSVMQERGGVTFPMAYKEERNYMVPFYAQEGLPYQLKHWQHTVDDMLSGIEVVDRPIYFMSDTKFVEKGETSRRPGLHVDGYWHPAGRWDPWPPSHKAVGAHRSHPGYHGPRHGGVGRHRGRGGHGGGHMSAGWDRCDFSQPEALILASNVTGARALVGDYDGPIQEGGAIPDEAVIDQLEEVRMYANKVYAGTVGTLHESLPVSCDCWRTVVRLNCPGVVVN